MASSAQKFSTHEDHKQDCTRGQLKFAKRLPITIDIEDPTREVQSQVEVAQILYLGDVASHLKSKRVTAQVLGPTQKNEIYIGTTPSAELS